MARPAKRESGLLEEFLRGPIGFFEERGISPSAGIGFSLLLLAGILALLYSSLQAPPPELRALVLSNEERVSDALVEVYSQEGELLASGTAGSDGQIAFKKDLLNNGRVVIKASKAGFVAADGSRHAIALVDLGKKTRVALELYSSHVAPGDFKGEIAFTVLDRISGKPIENAELSVLAGEIATGFTTDSNGLALLRVSAGKMIRITASADGYHSEGRAFVAIRGEEKISLLPRQPPAGASPAEFAAQAPQPLRASDSVLEDALPQFASAFLPKARVFVTDSSGNALKSGALRVLSSSGQELASSLLSDGGADFDNLFLSQEFRLEVEGADSGRVEVFDSASPGTPAVLSAPMALGSASLSPIQRSSFAAGQAPQSRLLLTAKSFHGSLVNAAFSVQGVGGCSGATCVLGVPSDQLLSISASAPGHYSAFASKKVPAGELLTVSFALVLQEQELGVLFHGARDEQGRPVSSLVAGRNYVLLFSLFSNLPGSSIFSVRLGELSHVREEGFGIADFPPQSFFSTKSASYSPQPTCTDLNNNDPVEGLFKWTQLFFEGSGPVHKIVSIPVRVKSNSRQNSMKIFYRLESRSGSVVSRVPEDASLDAASGEAPPSRADCYADSLAAELPIVFSNNCFEGTAPGFCSLNSPLYCSRRQDGSLSFSPGSQCCPAGTILAGDACVTTGQQSGDCADGTAEGQCSGVNSPRLCSGGVLVAAAKCCFPGEVFEKAACRPKAASCPLGSRVFDDGACLPTKPGRCLNGLEFDDAPACGCPEGLQANGNSCGATASALCDNGTALGTCAAEKPKHCVSIGGRLLLIDNALACGCLQGFTSSGVRCVPSTPAAPTLPGQQPSTPLLEPTPAPARFCGVRDSCLSPDKSDDYCGPQGLVLQSCLACNRNCGGNPLLSCSLSTGSCAPMKCLFPPGSGTPVGQCVEENAPLKCEIVGGKPVLLEDAQKCGCQKNFKPEAGKCVACQQPGCGDSELGCVDDELNWRSPGQCLPGRFSLVSAGSAEGIKKCLAGGDFAPSIADCGCPAGFMRNFDNSECVREPASGALLSAIAQGLRLDATCPGCVDEESIIYSDGGLKTKSGSTSFKMAADASFAADAFKVKIERGSLPPQFRDKISLQLIESDSRSEACYRHDAATEILSFKLGGACPIEVRGDSFYNTAIGREVSSDSARLRFKLETVPPSELVLEIRVALRPSGSLLLLPTRVSGPGTPQFVFLVNNKQSPFGPRELQLNAPSPVRQHLAGAGVKVFAWRGPGELSASEAGQQVGSVSYGAAATYFAGLGDTGPRIEKCTGDAFCCMGGWCNGNAFSSMFNSFNDYARNLATRTAFRRGGGQPFKTIMDASKKFEAYTAAQVVDAAPSILSSSGIRVKPSLGCSQSEGPAVYSIRASTADGINFEYDAETAALRQPDYIDGGCSEGTQFSEAALLESGESVQPLCDFIYGDGACVYRSRHSLLVTLAQNSDVHSFLNVPQLLVSLEPFFQTLLRDPRLLASASRQPVAVQASGASNSVQLSGLQMSRLVSLTSESQKVSFEEQPPATPAVPVAPPGQQLARQVLANANSMAFTPRDHKWPEMQEKVDACRQAGRAYGQAHSETDRKCAAQEGAARTGQTNYWIGNAREFTPAPAQTGFDFRRWHDGHGFGEGRCQGGAQAGQTCRVSAFFSFMAHLEKIRNKDEVIAALIELEESGHDPAPGTVLSNAPQKSRVDDAVAQVKSTVEEAIEDAKDVCRLGCNEGRDSAALGAENPCTPRTECTGISGCLAVCEDMAAEAKRVFEERFKLCTDAVGEEIGKGSDCERLAAVMGERPPAPGSPLPERKAYFTCYAWRSCEPACQSMKDLVEVVPSNGVPVAEMRWGIGGLPADGNCVERRPTQATQVLSQNPNSITQVMRILSERARTSPTPPPVRPEGAGSQQSLSPQLLSTIYFDERVPRTWSTAELLYVYSQAGTSQQIFSRRQVSVAISEFRASGERPDLVAFFDQTLGGGTRPVSPITRDGAQRVASRLPRPVPRAPTPVVVDNTLPTNLPRGVPQDLEPFLRGNTPFGDGAGSGVLFINEPDSPAMQRLRTEMASLTAVSIPQKFATPQDQKRQAAADANHDGSTRPFVRTQQDQNNLLASNQLPPENRQRPPNPDAPDNLADQLRRENELNRLLREEQERGSPYQGGGEGNQNDNKKFTDGLMKALQQLMQQMAKKQQEQNQQQQPAGVVEQNPGSGANAQKPPVEITANLQAQPGQPAGSAPDQSQQVEAFRQALARQGVPFKVVSNPGTQVASATVPGGGQVSFTQIRDDPQRKQLLDALERGGYAVTR